MSPKINIDVTDMYPVCFPNSQGFGEEFDVDALTLTRWANAAHAFFQSQAEMRKLTGCDQ